MVATMMRRRRNPKRPHKLRKARVNHNARDDIRRALREPLLELQIPVDDDVLRNPFCDAGSVGFLGEADAEVEVELVEDELEGDAREHVRDAEEGLEVAPREVERDLAPGLGGEAFA